MTAGSQPARVLSLATGAGGSSCVGVRLPAGGQRCAGESGVTRLPGTRAQGHRGVPPLCGCPSVPESSTCPPRRERSRVARLGGVDARLVGQACARALTAFWSMSAPSARMMARKVTRSLPKAYSSDRSNRMPLTIRTK